MTFILRFAWPTVILLFLLSRLFLLSWLFLHSRLVFLLSRQNMPCNLTQFPNLLNHRTHFKAIAVVKEFRAVVCSKCSPLFRLFDCSILAPPCDVYQKPTPPCQQLCLKAVRSSKHLLTKHKITLLSAMQCWC